MFKKIIKKKKSLKSKKNKKSSKLQFKKSNVRKQYNKKTIKNMKNMKGGAGKQITLTNQGKSSTNGKDDWKSLSINPVSTPLPLPPSPSQAQAQELSKAIESVKLTKAPSKDKPKVALFFDNDAKNFDKGTTICNNVLNLKIRDNDNFTYSQILDDLYKIAITEEEYNDYEKFIDEDFKFDGTSGISTIRLNLLANFLNTIKNPITDIILDFDRTFTMTEGCLFATTTLLENVKSYLENDESISYNYEKESQNFLNLIMGGIARREAMKNLLSICIKQNIKITILTNNPLPLNAPTLIPDILRLILGKDNIDDVSMIDIISTNRPNKIKSKNPEKSISQVTKYEVINTDLEICKYIDPQIIVDLLVNLDEYVNGLTPYNLPTPKKK